MVRPGPFEFEPLLIHYPPGPVEACHDVGLQRELLKTPFLERDDVGGFPSKLSLRAVDRRKQCLPPTKRLRYPPWQGKGKGKGKGKQGSAAVLHLIDTV